MCILNAGFIDFYLFDNLLAIEVDGKHHKTNDTIKNILLEKNNIKLIKINLNNNVNNFMNDLYNSFNKTTNKIIFTKKIYNLLYMDIDIDKYKLYLGIIDNLHDFFDLKVYKTKKECEYLFDKLFIFINFKYKDYIIDLTKYIITEYKTKNVNSSKLIKKDVKNAIINFVKPDKIKITELHKQNIENFNKLFNVSNIDDIIQQNLNTLISNEQKILLRHPLYFYIKTKDEKILNFILKYCNLDIYNYEINNKIKIAIVNNLKTNIFNNKTYPITYFDDTTDGLNIKYNRFYVLNLDKNKIDSANVTKIEKYIEKYNLGKSSKNTITNTNNNIGFKLLPNDKHKFIDVEYYIENENIVCNYYGIKLIIKNNSAGRLNSFGIYQTTLLIVDIFTNCFSTDLTKLSLLLKNEIELNKNNLKNIIDITNLHNQLNYVYLLYKTLDLCLGCIVFLLFGFKRFGDWKQMELSSKLYLTLQTTDYYCKLFGILIGAPVILDDSDDTVYNYNPKEDLLLDNFILFNETTNTKPIKKTNKLIYKGLRDVNTDSINRYYFTKYKKYKTKYLELKTKKLIL